mgnify:CR=1 FL=1
MKNEGMKPDHWNFYRDLQRVARGDLKLSEVAAIHNILESVCEDRFHEHYSLVATCIRELTEQLEKQNQEWVKE